MATGWLDKILGIRRLSVDGVVGGTFRELLEFSTGHGVTLTLADDAANSRTVLTIAAGLTAVRFATTANLVATRSGNVLTASANGTMAAIDGVTPVVGDRVLVKDQTTGADNGLYSVTSVGSGSSAYSLTRAADLDSSTDAKSGIEVRVSEGSAWKGSKWQLATANPITLNTTALTWLLIDVAPAAATHTSAGAAYETVAALTYTVPEGWFVDVTFKATGHVGADYAHYERAARFTRLVGGPVVTDWDVPIAGAPKEIDVVWDAKINVSTNDLQFQVKANSDNPAWTIERYIVPKALP